MIKCKNVSLRIGKTTVISDVSFAAESGKITVLIGRNGSGKTSLIRCISGMTSYAGSIEVDGVELNKMRISERATCISYMPQYLSKPRISAREMISMGRAPYLAFDGKLSETDDIAVNEAISALGVEKYAERLVCHLSGGERQLAFLAMTTVHETENIILDEPTSDLDVKSKRLVYDYLRKKKAEGKTVILSLHDINDAIKIADMITVMDNGRAVFSGNCEEFIYSHIPEDMFGLRKAYIEENVCYVE